MSTLSYDASYLTDLPNDVPATCSTAAGIVTVGVQHVWARLDQDGSYALINR
ncbi:MAG: hypothetical protein ACRBBM_08925 [Pseudomonadaceae bacterium]